MLSGGHLPDQQYREFQLPGGRPLRPGDLDNLSPQQKHDEIVKRAKYLVNDDVVVPAHIQTAHMAILQAGRLWQYESQEKIYQSISNLPYPVPSVSDHIWKRGPQPPSDSLYLDLIPRIHDEELRFYDFRPMSNVFNGTHFLNMLRATHRMSFRGRLNEHGVIIDKVVHFGRKAVPGEASEFLGIAPPTPTMEDKRRMFVWSVAWTLGVQAVTHYVPPHDDKYLEEGIIKIDKHTLVFDTTFNNSILRVIQEANLNPGVIIKQFRYWRDGADEDARYMDHVRITEYGPTHWLTEYYEVFSSHPGSGFVACYPAIYIQKRIPVKPVFKWPPRRLPSPETLLKLRGW
ncbi:hypothetical protein C8A03DRAFT_34938 [Achaetomium macrosporum]|uniref:Uncharacterized protein n=1 Tax=Achaetomium macrosporum TaxID=79813 RepID=A0AAN7HD80_9PEZI|nr:hypothetical protein C8A03DRAFT_34938 [Achaetomium macrosporum]